MNLDVSYLNTKQRVLYGKKVEESILNSLKHVGYDIKYPTIEEDTKYKIDGYIKSKNKYLPIQIKYRSKRTDIIYEMTCIDDIYGNEKSDQKLSTFDGRDFISNAVIYVSLSCNCKTLRLCLAEDIRKNGIELTNILINKWRKNKNIKCYSNKYGQVKIITDNYSGIRKIIFFAKPEKCCIPSLIEINLKTPILV